MKKYIISLVVMLVVIAGTFFYFESREEKELEQFASVEQTGSETVAEQKTYTMSDIALHNTKSDCWMTIKGTVLDVTSFVDKHPGGDRILEGCGKDATSYFEKVPGHNSGIAKMLLNKLKIGELVK